MKQALGNFAIKHPRLVIPAGFLAGLIVGSGARAWMRWISTDPEFTWGGTLGIVIGFAIFGAVQGAVYLVRSKERRRWVIILARILGTVFSLQLFVAAGAIMFPTVFLLSLAIWRKSWIKLARIFLAALGGLIWVLIIKTQILDYYDWNIATIGRILLFGLIYASIIWALKSTVSPHAVKSEPNGIIGTAVYPKPASESAAY